MWELPRSVCTPSPRGRLPWRWRSLLASEPYLRVSNPRGRVGAPRSQSPRAHAQVPRFHAGTRRSAHPPLRPARQARAGSGEEARGPTDGLGTGQAEGVTPAIPGPHRNRPPDSARAVCPAEPAARPAPPRRAAPANPGEGPAHPRAPLGEFNLPATPLAGQDRRGWWSWDRDRRGLAGRGGICARTQLCAQVQEGARRRGKWRGIDRPRPGAVGAALLFVPETTSPPWTPPPPRVGGAVWPPPHGCFRGDTWSGPPPRSDCVIGGILTLCWRTSGTSAGGAGSVTQQPSLGSHIFAQTLPSSAMLLPPKPSQDLPLSALEPPKIGNMEFRLSFNKWRKLRPRESQRVQGTQRKPHLGKESRPIALVGGSGASHRSPWRPKGVLSVK